MTRSKLCFPYALVLVNYGVTKTVLSCTRSPQLQASWVPVLREGTGHGDPPLAKKPSAVDTSWKGGCFYPVKFHWVYHL